MGRRLTEERIIIFGGFSWIWGSEFEFCSRGRIITGGTGLLGVLGTGARISIWYPGARKSRQAAPSWQGGNTVWAELISASSSSKATTRQQGEGTIISAEISIRSR
jgi:hypothetical protein